MSVKTIYSPELKPLTQSSDAPATTLGRPDKIKILFDISGQFLTILDNFKSILNQFWTIL